MGGASARSTGAVREIARLLGASSPTTTCSVVLSRNASAAASPKPPIVAASPSSGSRRPWKAGTPIAPSPSDAAVIPSWQAER